MAETLVSLISALRGRSAPLPIDLEDGCIAAARCGYDGPYDFNITFHHPEGDIRMGLDAPTRAEYLGLNTPEFHALPYPEKRGKVLGEYDEDGMWLTFDGDGEIEPSSDTEDRLTAWLSKRLEDEEAVCSWPEWLSQFLPGFEIYGALPEADRTRLGLRKIYLGAAPGCDGIAAVAVKATPSELDEVLVARGLPFRVRVVAEGSMDTTGNAKPGHGEVTS